MPEEERDERASSWGELIFMALTLLAGSGIVALVLKGLYGLVVSGYPFLALWLGLFTIMFVNDVKGR